MNQNSNDYNTKLASLSLNLIDINNDILLRHLCPNDVPELKKLCTEWFPVDYPDTWYQDIAGNKKFYSMAAIHNNSIIGMIVAEIKLKKMTDREDCNILSNKHDENTQITYILSLGVDKAFRRLGIASLLLDTLFSYLKTSSDCKAIYLHVLCTNKTAINFYEKRKFQQRIFLPKYYTIKGKHHDGYCYVYYMNNGEPPWTISDCMQVCLEALKSFNPFRLVYYFDLKEEYIQQTALLINTEWPRSLCQRVLSLKQNVRDDRPKLPVSVVLIESGQVIGHASITGITTSSDLTTNLVFIQSVIIEPSLRGKGIGKMLMLEIEKYIKDYLRQPQTGFVKTNFDFVYLNTKDKQLFYEGLGYERIEPILFFANKNGKCNLIMKNLLKSMSSQNTSQTLNVKSLEVLNTCTGLPPSPPPPPPLTTTNTVNNELCNENVTWYKKKLI